VAPKRQIPEHNLRHRNLAALEFRSIPFAVYTRRHRDFPYHRHDFHEILLVEQGHGVHEIDFRPYPVGPRSLFFIHPKQVHLLQRASLVSGAVVIFSGVFLDGLPGKGGDLLRQFVEHPLLSPSEREWEVLRQSYAVIQGELAGEHPDAGILKAALTTFLLLAARCHQRQHPTYPTASLYDHSLFADFNQLLEACFHQQHALPFYAQTLKVSERQLNQVVRQFAGKTAFAFLQDRLLLEAKRQLLFSSREIKAIALETGFADPYYFSRFFKKKAGLSPEQFRKGRYQSPSDG
jgi:AraC-like DNA-binding protein/mannose-6-phosphate isomerase-like protein (cupin superfamily)